LACYEAAVNGHLEALKWMKENDCFDPFLCDITEHEHVLEWLREIGVLGDNN